MAQGMALLRMAFGLYFLVQALAKLNWLVSGQPLGQQLQQALPRAEGFYQPFLAGTVLPNVDVVARLVTLGEWVTGLLLLLGLFTRLGALIGMWLNLNYMLMKGLVSPAGSIDRLFFLAELVFLATAAGLIWGLDRFLRPWLGRLPVVRWLAGLAGPEEAGALGEAEAYRRTEPTAPCVGLSAASVPLKQQDRVEPGEATRQPVAGERQTAQGERSSGGTAAPGPQREP
jgi:uncharacterized membrane protein YphA (DoxX/SURF4 family)